MACFCESIHPRRTLFVLQVLQKYLSPTEVEQLARATEFVRRTSKYRGKDLVTLCV
jgi:hypothetical protein